MFGGKRSRKYSLNYADFELYQDLDSSPSRVEHAAKFFSQCMRRASEASQETVQPSSLLSRYFCFILPKLSGHFFLKHLAETAISIKSSGQFSDLSALQHAKILKARFLSFFGVTSGCGSGFVRNHVPK